MKNEAYDYPLNTNWRTAEIIIVMRFYQDVEEANEHSIKREQLLDDYHAFKRIVTSKSEEKQLDQAFQKATGYSIYHTVKQCLATEEGKHFQMKK